MIIVGQLTREHVVASIQRRVVVRSERVWLASPSLSLLGTSQNRQRIQPERRIISARHLSSSKRTFAPESIGKAIRAPQAGRESESRSITSVRTRLDHVVPIAVKVIPLDIQLAELLC
jgi:hypothetical protein